MARIVIRNLGKSVEVKDFSKTILHHVQAAHIDWMHACGGNGRCTTCKARVLSGGQNLSSITAAERNYQQQGMLSHHERLICQAKLSGDVTLDVAEEGKLPHLTYF
jgi:ferredoxin, 2Fe-2S